jgi:hypothetical protein
MLQERLVSFLDMLANHVTVGENFEPVFSDRLLGEVVVLGFLFLLSEEFSDFLEISVIEGVSALNDGIDFVDVWLEGLSELSLAFFLLSLQLFVEPSLFNEVAINCNSLHLFLESWQFLYLLFYLFFDINLH